MTEYTAPQIVAALKGSPVLSREGHTVVLTAIDYSSYRYPLRGTLFHSDGAPSEGECWSIAGEFMPGEESPYDIDIDYYMGLAHSGLVKSGLSAEPSRPTLDQGVKDDLTGSLDVAISLMATEVTAVFKSYGSLDEIKALLDHRANLTNIKKILESLS